MMFERKSSVKGYIEKGWRIKLSGELRMHREGFICD